MSASTFRYILASILLAVSLVSVRAAAGTRDALPAPVAELSLPMQHGKGRINGVELPFTRIDLGDGEASRDLFAAIKEKAKGSYTVKVSHTALSQVIFLLPVYSDDCPTCRKPTKDNIQEIMNDTYAVSVFQLGDKTFAMGAPSGRLLGAVEAPSYDGELLDETRKYLRLSAHSEYVFGDSYSSQLQGSLAMPMAQAKHMVEQDLKRLGYEPHDPRAAVGEGELNVHHQSGSHEGLWKKGPSVVYVNLKQQNLQTTEFGLYENITN